jgi:hypothetical protein
MNYSGRLARKGVLIEETYRVFCCWSLDKTLRENIADIREKNPIGAKNQAWLREVTATISNRFSNGASIAPLVILAKGGLSVDIWKYCLLWHIGTTDGLYSDFVTEFLFPRVDSGIAVFTTDDVIPYVQEVQSRGVFEEALSDYGVRRLARDLLRTAGEFGFVEGKARREICHPVIPEDALLYAIYGLWDDVPSADRLVSSNRWKLFLMRSAQVEQEMLNLHQFRRLNFEQAGSIRELALPHHSLLDFAKSLVS